MSISTSILKSVLANVERDFMPNDDYGVAWYRGMITAALHDEVIDADLLKRANLAVDTFRARRNAKAVSA